MADTKYPKDLTPVLTMGQFQRYCKDVKVTQATWDKACDMLNNDGGFNIDDMLKQVKGCLADIADEKAQKKAARDAKKG